MKNRDDSIVGNNYHNRNKTTTQHTHKKNKRYYQIHDNLRDNKKQNYTSPADTKNTSTSTITKATTYPMRSTNIITAFVQDARSGKILILKRSRRVKTMRGLWSGISGIIEGRERPFRRAKIEIFEEVGITQDKIRLVNYRDSAIRINSPQYKNHEWIIFPFLFEVKRPKVTLNWENSKYKWINAKDIRRYNVVPDLEKVLFCVL